MTPQERIDKVVLEAARDGLVEAQRMALTAGASVHIVRAVVTAIWIIAGEMGSEGEGIVSACAKTLSVLEPDEKGKN